MAIAGAWKQCPNGHWYDSSASPFCPQCAGSQAGQYAQEYYATMPLNGGNAPPLNGGNAPGILGETQPAAAAFEGFPPTEPVQNSGSSFRQMPTMINFDEPAQGGASGAPLSAVPAQGGASGAALPAVHDYGKNGRAWDSFSDTVEDYDRHPVKTAPSAPAMGEIGVTVPVNPFSAEGRQGNFSPVVGWLVCIEGGDRGRDYRIHAGYNSIGRSERMDIYLSGDDTISRDRHARIAYDPDERLFLFGPDEGKNLVRLNGKMVMGYSELHPYDIISISRTKLMFVPFCGERFNWDE